jgi:hypothetical protein
VSSKRLAIPIGVLVALVAAAPLSFAGDFHFGISLVCADCHVMHYSQSHGYNPNGTGNIAPIGTDGPYHYLLRNDVNDLCLSCHDGQSFAPDVFETHGNGYVRQGGALNEEGGNGLYPPPTGHTLNSTDIAPGSNPPWNNPDGLNCANCHAVHGANQTGISSYRNLGGFGTEAGGGYALSYSFGTNDLGTWVFEDTNGGTNGNHYGFGAITFNEPDETSSQYAEFCKSCHEDFHGAVGGTEIGGTGSPPEEFVRHPANGVQIGAIGGGHSSLSRFAGKVNQVQVMSPDGVRAGNYTTSNTNLTQSCMSCHKGHGNQNAFGLIYMLGTGTITEQGDDGIDARNMCRQCHGQGGNATNY